MNMHEWMEPYSHRMAQWRTPESSGTGAACIPLDRSRMPTYSRAAEWNASKIIVNVCVDLCPFCWNVHLIWQYFVDRRKVNAWAWLLMMYFSYILFMAIQIVNFVTWITAELHEFHEIQSHDRYAYSLARELRTCALQGRRRLLEGRDKIVIHRTSANKATQYTGNWAWTFRLVTRSSD